MDQDAQNLNLLSIFHYVVGGLAALFSMFPVIHLVIGISFLSGALPADGEPAIQIVGLVFVVIASVIILLGLTVAGLIVWAGVNLGRRTRYTYCLVVAGVECLFMPFGTVLGILTLVMLTKPPVKEMFGMAPAPPAGEVGP
jgi:hypothetical protein